MSRSKTSIGVKQECSNRDCIQTALLRIPVPRWTTDISVSHRGISVRSSVVWPPFTIWAFLTMMGSALLSKSLSSCFCELFVIYIGQLENSSFFSAVHILHFFSVKMQIFINSRANLRNNTTCRKTLKCMKFNQNPPQKKKFCLEDRNRAAPYKFQGRK